MDEAQIPSQDSNQNSNGPKRSAVPAWAVGVIIVAILTAGAAAAYVYWSRATQPQSQDQNPSAEIPGDQEPSDNSNATTTPSTSDATSTAVTCKTYIPATRQLSGQIAWSQASKVGALDIFWADSDPASNAFVKTNSQFFKVGNVVSGSYSGFEVILADIAVEGPAFYPNYYRFLRQDNKVVLLGKYSPELSEGDGIDHTKFTVDKAYYITDLDYPKTFQGATNRENFELDQFATFAFCADGLTKLFHHAVLGDVYSSLVQSRNDGTGLAKNGGSYGFYMASPDGTAKVYKLVIDFQGTDNVPQVTWSDGAKNTSEYTYTDVGGCGSANYLSVMTPERVNPATDLAEAGVNSLGDKIYALRDPNHALLKDNYDKQYFVYEGEKITYEQFVKSRPVFFWYDPFGRLVKFQNNKFVPQAECGKPVIYLYPTSEQKVSVKLSPRGGFSYTEPAYNNGWNVLADPSGQLTEISTGKTYPYLFWEGRGGIYPVSADKGFMVSRQQVHNFLGEKLSKLGLNSKESADFMEFWEPRMASAPYYFVTFYGKSLLDNLAPLNVEPMPDTVIRVLMDFKPLQKPVPVQEYQIQTPARRGFTVVEWGGVLRSE